MKFITYYTSKYADCAHKLEEDAIDLKLELVAEPLEDFRDWQQATRFKATFIGGAIKHLNDDVCWIDADARIRSNPTLITELSSKEYDVAAVYFKDKELLSGTLWMANTSIVKDIIKDWIELNVDGTKSCPTEQRNLQVLLESKKYKDVRICRLPPEYAFIFDLSANYYRGLIKIGDGLPHVEVSPVIEHFQRSRQIRREENVQHCSK
jgi:hypothetical protein